MNSIFTVKLLQNLRNKKGEKGFTLIELLVVVIIIGVLAAIALPNLLGQVAKGRQAEAKNNLGAINRGQQAYRLEKATFGTIGDGETGTLPVKVTGQYYDYADIGSASATFAAHSAKAKNDFTNDIRDYNSSVSQSAAGAYDQTICEGQAPNSTYSDITTAGCQGAFSPVN